MIESTSKIAIIFSVAGICILYFICKSSAPPLVSLSDVHFYEGSVVSVRGFVDDVSIKKGNAILTLVNGSDTLKIFVHGGDGALKRGYEVIVEGSVRVFRGDHEVFTTPDRIRIVNESASIVYSVSQIASEPLKFVGKNVCVSGRICKSYTHVFYLRDSSGVGTLRVVHQHAAGSISTDEHVAVEGLLVYNPEIMRYELMATSISHLRQYSAP